MAGLSGRLDRLERRAGLHPAEGPYSDAWKASNYPPFDYDGYRETFAEIFVDWTDEEFTPMLDPTADGEP